VLTAAALKASFEDSLEQTRPLEDRVRTTVHDQRVRAFALLVFPIYEAAFKVHAINNVFKDVQDVLHVPKV